MKYIISALIAGALGIAGVLVGVSVGGSSIGGSAQFLPTYSSASSTIYATGNQVSTKVLDSYSKRAYARLCNINDNQDAYLVLGTGTIKATSSADQVIRRNECLEIDRDALYIGQISVLMASASTTQFLVTELRD